MNLSPSASHSGHQGGLHHTSPPPPQQQQQQQHLTPPPHLSTGTIPSGTANITTNPNYVFSSNAIVDPDSITTTSFYSQFPPQQQQQQQHLFYEDHLQQQQQQQMLVEDSRNKWHSTGNVPDPRVHHFRTSLNTGGHVVPNVSEYASVDIQHLPAQQQQHHHQQQHQQQQHVNGSATVGGKIHHYRSLQPEGGMPPMALSGTVTRNPLLQGEISHGPPPPPAPSGSGGGGLSLIHI